MHEATRAKDREARRAARTVYDEPVVLEAGAGTGKTSVLTARILSWLLGRGWEEACREGGGDPASLAARRVLALTFTEAAAAEMRARVAQGLTLLAQGKEPPAYLGISAEELRLDAKEFRDRALRLVANTHLVTATTIHSFCLQLLQTWPMEAGIRPDPVVDADGSILEELARKAVRRHVVPSLQAEPRLQVLATVGLGPDRLFEILVEAAERDALSLIVEGPTASLPRHVPEEVLEHLAAIRRAFWNKKEEKGSRIRAGAYARTLEAVLEAGYLETRDPRYLLQRLVHVSDTLAALSTSGSQWAKALWEDVGDHVRSVVAFVHDLVLGLVRGALRSAALDVAEEVRRRGVVTFSSMQVRAVRLVREHEAIRQALRDRYRLIVVDEFQDTDALQCELLELVALQGDRQPSLMLVGDPKQSIYGWRDADLDAYYRFVHKVLGSREPYRLSVNFRSVPEILEETARILRPLMGPSEERGGGRGDGKREGAKEGEERGRGTQPLQPAYEDLVAHRTGGGDEPAVEHWILWERDENRALRPKAEDLARAEARAVASDMLAKRRRGVAWSDMAILMRKGTHRAVFLAELDAAGIPYTVAAGKEFYTREEIEVAANLLLSLFDPTDELALFALLRSPLAGVPNRAILRVWTPEFLDLVRRADTARSEAARAEVLGALWQRLREVAGATAHGHASIRGWDLATFHCIQTLSRLRSLTGKRPVDEVLWTCRTALGLEVLQASLGDGSRRLANLEALFQDIERALEDSAQDQEGVVRTIRRAIAEQRARAEPDHPERGRDAVCVSTIHQAKGLEFGHVYLVQMSASRDGRPHGDPVRFLRSRDGTWEYRWPPAQTSGFQEALQREEAVAQAELLRTLYVAMTRARDRLVLVSAWPGGERIGRKVTPPRFEGPPRSYAHAVAQGREIRVDGRTIRDPMEKFQVLESLFLGLERDEERTLPLEGPRVTLTFWDVESLAEPLGASAPTRPQTQLGSALERAENWQAQHEGLLARQDRTLVSGPSASTKREIAASGRGERTERALDVGLLVHEALARWDLQSDAPDALVDWLETTFSVTGTAPHTAAAIREARAIFRQADALLQRLKTLGRENVLGREVPMLLPSSGTAGAGPVSHWHGRIDLVYRDPETGQVVVADYKTDHVPAEETGLRARAVYYAPQLELYARAVAAALGLESVRREIWFLRAGRCVVL